MRCFSVSFSCYLPPSSVFHQSALGVEAPVHEDSAKVFLCAMALSRPQPQFAMLCRHDRFRNMKSGNL